MPFVLGVNCSEVIEKENCERVCDHGTCVQVSSVSYTCMCDTGVNGKSISFTMFHHFFLTLKRAELYSEIQKCFYWPQLDNDLKKGHIF